MTTATKPHPEPLSLPETPAGLKVWPYLYRSPEDVGERALAVVEWDFSEHPHPSKRVFCADKVRHRLLGFIPARVGMVLEVVGNQPPTRLVGFGQDPNPDKPEDYADPREWIELGEVCLVDIGRPRPIHDNSGRAFALKALGYDVVGTVTPKVLAPQLDAAGNIRPGLRLSKASAQMLRGLR